ncbi:MAG: phage holin family protein [Roseiflexaceae bacterium]|nr:phage holin family protein [Roseiflexaceae bacterium]
MIIQPPTPPSRWQQARTLSLRWLISTLAIFAAVQFVPGITFVGPGWELGLIAMIFGLVNLALRPILTILTCPLVILTLGFFGLVINAMLLILTAQIATSFGFRFEIDGFWPAFWGGLVISVVTTILSIMAGDRNMQVVVGDGPNDRPPTPPSAG